MLLSEGQMSDYKGAALMIDALPKAKALLADRGYDANWFRAALAERGIAACIPSRSNRKVHIPHDPMLYRQRHRIENMFGKLKDWRRIHTRYDRCAHTFFSAICIAATIIFRINQRVLSLAPVRKNCPRRVDLLLGRATCRDAIRRHSRRLGTQFGASEPAVRSPSPRGV